MQHSLPFSENNVNGHLTDFCLKNYQLILKYKF